MQCRTQDGTERSRWNAFRVRHAWCATASLLLCATLALPAAAQEAERAAQAERAEQPAQAQHTRATPRSSMLGYLTACREGDYDQAAGYLDTSGAPNADGAKLARWLKFVLDQKLWVDLESLSDQPQGDTSDGSARRDTLGVIETKRGAVPVRLQRAGSGEWQIARATVAEIDELYAEFGIGVVGELLPEPLLVRVGELAIWQWLGLAGALILAYALGSLGVVIGLRFAGRLMRRNEMPVELLHVLSGPLTALAMLGFFSIAALLLRLPAPALDFLHLASRVLVIVLIAWLAMRAVDATTRELERRVGIQTDTMVLTVIPVGRRLTKVFLLILAVLASLQNVGINVVSIVAGLGVIGIGVALAAQTTFENFFGTLSILIDQPVRRGDVCRFNDKVGTIEDIGLRSTRIRTLDRTVITVPNGEFSSLHLENFGARDQMRLYAVLGLRYETSADQMRHVLIGLKRLLVSHPRVTADPARVRFVGFGAHSLDVEIYAHVDTQDYAEFLAIREDVLLRMIDVVEASGTGFAFPSQTLYLGRDSGLDAERRRAAEQDVHELRERGELPLPDVPEVLASKLRGSLAYPPSGSATANGPGRAD